MSTLLVDLKYPAWLPKRLLQRFFEKTFLVANVSLEVVLGMPFLTLSGTDIDFLGHELR